MYNKRSGAEIITVIIWIPGGDEISAYGTVYETIKINLRRRIVWSNQIRRCYHIPACINRIEEFSIRYHFWRSFLRSIFTLKSCFKILPVKSLKRWDDWFMRCVEFFFVSSIYYVFSRTTGKNILPWKCHQTMYTNFN